MNLNGLFYIVLLSCSSMLLFLSFLTFASAAEDKYYSDNGGEISNKGYWGKQRGHLGGKEQLKERPITEEARGPDVIPEPLYFNLSFGLELQSNYEDYSRNGTSLANNPGLDFFFDDIFTDDLVWQANIDYKNDDVLISNGIGILPNDSLVGIGINAFWDSDLSSGHQRLSVGAKYDDPNYILNLSSNIYFPVLGKGGVDDFVNSMDIRSEGMISPTVLFHTSFEYLFGDNIQVSDDYDPTNESYKLTAGFGYTPIPLLQLGIEATKVKEHDVGYGVYLYFNYDPWRTFSKQLEWITDNNFSMHKMIPFSRSKIFVRRSK